MIRARRTVEQTQAYQAPVEGRSGFTRLDFNENTLLAGNRNQYPEYAELLSLLSKETGVETSKLIITNGSSEALFLAAFAFIEPGEDKAVISKPTFSLIPHFLNLCGAELLEIPAAKDLEFDIQGLHGALKQEVKLAVFATPDNPTGAEIDRVQLEKWLERYPQTLFVIDRAYAEFSDAEELETLIERYENLLIVRTFSKAYGLAGSRLGFAMGAERIINLLHRVRAPYSVNSDAVARATALLEQGDSVSQTVSQIKSAKQWTARALEERGYGIKTGAANFVLINFGLAAESACTHFRDSGILVRNRSNLPGLTGMVRVSIASLRQMKSFITSLDRFKDKSALIFDLDDTLVDASVSYPEAVRQTVEHFGGSGFSLDEYWQLKAEGGFNDDWVTARQMLSARGIARSLDDISSIGKEIYLSTTCHNETLLFKEERIEELAARFRVFIFTGRPRREYEPVWRERFKGLFERVYCVDDFPGLRPKPSPDMLREIASMHELKHAWYVGNSVDDMRAAISAGFGAIGINTTLSRSKLLEAGAQTTISSISELPGEFGL